MNCNCKICRSAWGPVGKEIGGKTLVAHGPKKKTVSDPSISPNSKLPKEKKETGFGLRPAQKEVLVTDGTRRHILPLQTIKALIDDWLIFV